MLLSFFLLALGGILAGLLSGMLGIGGGIVVVPLLIYLLPLMGIEAALVVPMAVGTSLATIVVTTLSGAYAHHRHRMILWPWVGLIAPCMVGGGIVGAMLGVKIEPQLLQRIFATVLLLLAARMIWKMQPRADDKRIRRTPVRLWSVGIGVISSLVGIGGGALVVPLLHFYQITMRHAVAVAAVCSVLLAFVGTITYALLGQQVSAGVVKGAVGFIYLPAWLGIAVMSVLMAPVGARLARILPVRWLQRAFALLLIVVSVHLFVTV
ncbi:sulfite exporter TauE/SafE family protein [Aliidiomarina sedimenti]|uniref:Probable membrane transporter protein n=1 Tax=Aliidiomarina sedimenti TaxID=1933879 RepID=A0ABY0BYH9_9GAMM|nr:sulfite exporter TauE/SafE family protein [Aliidiomarina sedimenti]RUO29820.1 sulfite exporter TauE/SafE family protein [Aliidiomarina sedimenti]